MQALALGVLGWTPETFWSSTAHEVLDALDGYREANTVDDSKEREAEFVEWARDVEAGRRAIYGDD